MAETHKAAQTSRLAPAAQLGSLGLTEGHRAAAQEAEARRAGARPTKLWYQTDIKRRRTYRSKLAPRRRPAPNRGARKSE